MARKIEYQIGFTADTSQLQTALKEAASALQNIGKSSSNQLTAQLREASQAALDLETHLSNAYNAETGSLDLTVFQRNLQRSGETLEDYERKLRSIGPEGEQAFLKVAQAISAAELPIKRSSAMLDKLWITMKNTLRWQLTSGMLHGFIGAVQTAYGYTQDLNESLNSIRIVTQKSVEDMDKFAVKANEAAQTLSTTTTRYTDASLIYYQQGLSDEEVEDRTNVTIKLANVAGETAERASEQLTSIWNNFYDGTKSLEYYADVMTKLGATTASSTQEISQGLQKFAAVADTVGLSYEYAAAALATVTATTRESADIVGTAFRTLFGRLESLKLGETLDDETDLNKYSLALKSIGVDIKDVNGDLKDMDDILDETGAKWQLLARDQQMALAQTVAGVRQYAQFIALMDNWDFFQSNLQTAMGAEGSLEEQVDIFAESWEAARNRIRAASEDIYDSIFDDEKLIKLTNGATAVLHRVDNIVDSLGGLTGSLNMAFNVATQLYGTQMAQGMRDWVYNLQTSLGINQELAIALKEQATQLVVRNNNSDVEEVAQLLDLQNQAYERNKDAQVLLDRAAKSLTEEQQKQLKNQAEQVNLARQQVDEYIKAAQAAHQANVDAEQWVRSTGSAGYARVTGVSGLQEAFKGDTSFNRSQRQLLKKMSGLEFTNGRIDYSAFGDEEVLNRIRDAYISARKEMTNYENELKRLNAINEQDRTPEQVAHIRELSAALGDAAQRSVVARTALISGYGAEAEALTEFATTENLIVENTENASNALLRQAEALDALNEKINVFQQGDWATRIVRLSQDLSSVAISLQAIKNIGRIFSDEDMTAADRFTTAFMSLSMLLPVVTRLSEAYGRSLSGQAVAQSVVRALTAAEGETVEATGIRKIALTLATKALGKQELATASETQIANAALAGTAGAAGLALGALTALALVITLVANRHREMAEAARQANQATVDSAKTTKTEADNNRELLTSFNEALDAYDGSLETKADLDKASRALADAYNIEGAALAKLSGKYEDYNTVAREAVEQRRKELASTLEEQKKALKSAEDLLIDAARKGRGHKTATGDYQVDFSGWWSEDNKAYDILNRTVTAGSIGGASGVGDNRFYTNIDMSKPAEMLKLYDQLSEAYEKMGQELDVVERQNSGIYQGVAEWLNKMEDVVTQYREIEDNIVEIQGLLGQLQGQKILDTDVNSLDDYRAWVEDITTSLETAGKDSEYIEKAINNLVSTSLNDKIREFKTLDDAIKSVRVSIGDADFSDFGGLDEIWQKYDKGILITLNWKTITQETFESAYENAEKYQAALTKTEEGMQKVTSAQQALKDLSDGTLTSESVAALGADIDWEKYGEDFQSFLNGTYAQQQEFLNHLIREGYQEIINGNLEQIKIQEATIEQIKNEREAYQNETDELEHAHAVKNAWDDVLKAYNEYKSASASGDRTQITNAEKAAQDAIEVLHSLGEADTKTWNSFKFKTAEEVKEAVEEGSRKAVIYINKEDQFDIDEKAAQDAIEKAVAENRIVVPVAIQANIDSLENVTDTYVQVFNAIAKGVSRTTDDMGNSFWTFSIEATKAIDAIYPGFMANAEVMRDGTFKINDEMYESFFNMMNAEVAADGNGIAAMLENRIHYLESRRDEAKSALEIAEKLASGEITLDELTEEQKETLLTQYQDAKKISDENLLGEEVEYLEQSRGNHETLWRDVSDYSAQGAANMANNVSRATQSVLENLKSIRDGAYAAMQAMSGVENPPTVDTTVHWTGRGTGLLNSNINTSNANTFVRDLKGFQYQDLPQTDEPGEYNRQVSQAAGRALKEIYETQIDAYNSAIGAMKVAQAKLFKSIDDAYQKAGKADKSGSQARQQQLKDLEKIFERYHEITREIEYQERVLKKLATEIERTYGTKRLDLYKKKLQELNKLADLQAQKYEAAAAFIAVDAGTLESLGLNATTNDHYEITNYTELLEKSLADYNAALSDYNAKVNLEGADKDALEATLKEAKQLYDDRKDALEHYENSVDTYRDLIEAWEETQRNIEDEKLNEITYKMELVLDVKKIKEDVRNFMKEIAESYGDALTHTLDTSKFRGVASLMKDNAQAEIDMFSHYVEEYDSLKQRMAEANEFTDTEKLKEAMADLTHNIIESGEALLNWLDYWENMVPEAVDAARARFDKFTNQLAHNVTVLDSIKELYALQGQTYKTQEGFNRLQRTSQEKMEAQIANAELNRKWYERAAADLEKAQNELDSFKGDETSVEYDYLVKARDAFLKEFNDAQEAYLKSAQEAMETAREMYTLEIEKAVYQFGQAVSNGVGLDILQDKYDHYIDEEERYLDKVNEAYQVASWYNKLQADIDKATTKDAKDRLKALQEEIDIRRANNQLNQYDLDILEAKYKVLQAQLALEDAQAQKTNLRLVRDRQGNWNYQYTANPDDIANAEQDLLDAQNEWYNIAKQQVKDVTGEIISTWQECQSKIQEVYNDMTLTDQERAAKSQEIYEYYTQKIADLTREREIAQVDMTRAGNEELEQIAVDHGHALEDIIKSDSEVLTELAGDNTKLLNLFDNEYAKTLSDMTSSSMQFESILRTTLDSADTSFIKLQGTIQEVAIANNTSLQQLDETVQQVSDSTDELTQRGLEAADSMWNQVDAVYAAAESYREFARSVEEAIQALQALAIAQANDIEQYSGLNNNQRDDSYDHSERAAQLYAQGDYAGAAQELQWHDEKAADRGMIGIMSGAQISTLLTTAQTNEAVAEVLKKIMNGQAYFNNDTASLLHDLGIEGFATGGYTGNFNDAKLAFLHEKELVLNQQDTANILAAVEAIRAIEQGLDSNATAAQGLMAMRLGNPDIVLPQSQPLDQNIHIDEVSFPNVTSADGIEAAFRSLADNASQWVQRRRE